MATTHSPRFEEIKGYYDTGLWSKKAVRKAVDKGWLWYKPDKNIDEYKDITGENYI